MSEQQNTGKKVPVIDYNKCTGQGVCVEICPENIFEIRNLDQIMYCEDTKTTGLCPEPRYDTKKDRSYPVNIDNCTECGICIDKCPEHAITLVDKAEED